jgi:AAHS family 4-hydroxybenzoate transporter-like MFS transporter
VVRKEDSGSIDVGDVIDRSRLGGFQVRLFALCALCLIMDGFDVQVIGFVAPEIAREWGVSSASLGPVFAAGNLGVLIGALAFTMLADTIGRRPVLIGSTYFFAAMMLVTARATSVEELIVLRFITGLGLGSVIPSATALIGEYSPKRHRVTLMMVITVGFTAGAAFGGLIAAWLIPQFGWRSVFYFGGGVPLVIAAAMYLWLPESLQFLLLRDKSGPPGRSLVSSLWSLVLAGWGATGPGPRRKDQRPETRDPRPSEGALHLHRAWQYVRRIDPSVTPETTRLVVSEERRGGVPAAHLFRSGRAAFTLLLWFVNFMNILLVYSLANWLPTVVRDAGHSTRTAVLVGTVLQVGGTLGTLAFAGLIARFTFIPVLTAAFVLATLSIAAIGPSLPVVALLTGVVFLAGWCTIGAQPGLNALSATFYPTYLRSTGVGWGLGIGRIGAIVGPMIGGELMRRQWSGTELFYAASVPAVLAVLGTLALGLAMKGEGGSRIRSA